MPCVCRPSASASPPPRGASPPRAWSPGPPATSLSAAGELVAVTPTGAELANLSAEQVTVVDLDGRPVDGSLEPTSELDLHLGVYRPLRVGRGRAHPCPGGDRAGLRRATSCRRSTTRCSRSGGPVRVAPYATFGTPELAAGVLDALEGRTAALMASHGAVTHGHTLDAAVAATELLEWLCDVYARAAAMGSRACSSDDELADVDARGRASAATASVREREA